MNPISDARLEEALAILDRLGPAGSTEEQSRPDTPAAAALPASEASAVEHPAATPGAACAAAAPSGTPQGSEAVMAAAAATSDAVEGSLAQSVAATSLPPAKRARVNWTDAEDAAILEHVSQYGTRGWAQCAEAVGGGRTEIAVAARWYRRLKETDRGRAAQRRETMPAGCAVKLKPAARTAFRFDASVTRSLPAGVGAVALDFNGPRPATAADVMALNKL